MSRHFVTSLLAVMLSFAFVGAEEATPPVNATPPIKVLYITGGAFHDYKKMTPLFKESMEKYANMKIDVIDDEAVIGKTMKDPKLGEGYDVIVYNICVHIGNGPVDNAIPSAMEVIKNGKPAMMIHCSMHSFRVGDEWGECCGLVTKVHDGFRGFGTVKATPEHPIVKAFPNDWKTSGDELYQNIKFPETSIPLLRAHSTQSDKDHVVAWVHTFGKGNVFGTTLGHDMKTFAQPEFLQMLANGLLWTVGKLGDDGKPLKGFGGTESK